MHNGHSSNYAPLIKTTPSSSNNCQGAFLTHSWLGSHWWQRCPSADFPNSILPCAAGVPALGQPLRTTTCCGWGPPGLQRKRVRGTSIAAVCGGKQVDVNVRQRTCRKHKAKGKATGSKSNPKNRRWKGRRYTDTLCQWRGKMKWRSERTVPF